MKQNLGAQPYLFPMPVLIIGTYCEDDTPDAMNAAWGCISDYKQIALFLSEGHKTFANIQRNKAFTVAIADEAHVTACDYVGLVSANQEKRKMEYSGFTTTPSTAVHAPILNELPLVLECTLDHVDTETGCVYGNIVNVLAEDRVLTDGKVDMKKLKPMAYDPATRSYFAMGERVGTAFHDGAILRPAH